MADQKNHSFTSSSSLRLFTFRWILFATPLVLGYLAMEKALAQLPFSEAVKNDYIANNSEKIEVLVLGSSQVQRAINPKYMENTAVNLANKSQLTVEDYELLKHFTDQLPNLEIVVLEVGYDKLERDKSFTSPVLDHKNLKFYGVNTFNRPLRFEDRFLFHASPAHFSDRLFNRSYYEKTIDLNEYGFDENKYHGAYTYNTGIRIENVRDEETYRENLKILHEMIRFSLNEDLEVLIYHPPTHAPYNKLRDPYLLKKWRKLLTDLKHEYPEVKFFIDDTSSGFEKQHFYDGNHLNPEGAVKASQRLDSVLNVKFQKNS